MELTPQIRFLTGNSNNQDESQAGTVGFIFNRFDPAGIADMVPPSNWFSAGDIATGPTEVQEGDVFLVGSTPAEKVVTSLGFSPKWGAVLVTITLLAIALVLWRVAFDKHPGA